MSSTALGIAVPLALAYWCCGGHTWVMSRVRPRVAHLFAPGSAASQADHEARITALESRLDSLSTEMAHETSGFFTTLCCCAWIPRGFRVVLKVLAVLLIVAFFIGGAVNGLPGMRDSLPAAAQRLDRGRGFVREL